MAWALIVTVFFSLDSVPASFTHPEPTLKACVQAALWVEKHQPHSTAVCRRQV